MPPRTSRAFTLIDTAVTLGCTAAIAVLACVGMPRMRQVDQDLACAARLQSLSQASAQFALSSNDLMAGLTWQQGGASSQYPDVNALQAQSGFAAHAAQAVDIMRRRGRPDVPASPAWFADISYWTLALTDFQDRPLSDAFNLCPSHDNLTKWRRWPAYFDQGRFLPAQPAPGPASRRWPYMASYRLTGAAFDVSQSVLTSQAPSRRVSYVGSHNFYAIPASAVLGPSPMSMVAFPSQKAHVFDSHQRHLGQPDLYYAYPTSQQPILFFDSSVSVRQSASAITPWQPNNPSSVSPQTFNYAPTAWEPPTQNGQATQAVQDRFLWTRNGLLGRDF